MIELGRIVWKEYRAQRALWLAILVTGVLLQAFFVLATNDEGPRVGAYGAAITFPILFALASSAVLFAAEREEGTRELMRQLAPSIGRMLMGKLGFAAAGSALMMGLLWLIATLISKELLPIQIQGQHREAWQVGIILCADVLAWGLLFSLLMQRVLNAVCLTAVVATAVQYFHPYNHYALPALLAVDIWLARRWLTGAEVWQVSSLRWPLRVRQRTRLRLRDASAAERGPAWRRPMVRLVWQEWRHARAFVGIALAVGVVLLVASGCLSRFDFATAILPLAPLVSGLWVFQSEQEGQRFRFLAERGIPPSAVWLSKHLVWFPATVVLCLAFGAAFWVSNEVWDHRQRQVSSILADWSMMYVVLAYSLGQFLSLLLPRAVTAVFVGLILNAVLACWLLLMNFLQVPLLWSVGAIPLVLMAATLVHVRAWMLERRTTAVWLRLVAQVFVPAVLLVAGVAAYRVWEIPRRDPGFHVADTSLRATLEEAKTAELYRVATSAIVPSEAFDKQYEIVWQAKRGWPHATTMERDALTANARAIELTLAASVQPDGVFFMRGNAEAWTTNDFSQVRVLGTLLLLSARQLEADGELDKALDRYVAALRLARHTANGGGITLWLYGQQLQQQVYEWSPLWAVAAKQDAPRIAAGRRRIAQESSSFPPASEAIKVEYAVLQEILSQDVATRGQLLLGQPGEHIELYVLDRIAPWERVREKLILNYVAAEQIGLLQELDGLLNRPGTDLIDWHNRRFAEDRSTLVEIRRWQKTTPLLLDAGSFYANSLAITRINTAAHRSASLTMLALVERRGEHDQLPSRLDELDGNALVHALDPWSGQLLGYLPDDSGEALKFSNSSLRPPLLWSAGGDNARVLPFGKTNWGQSRYRVFPGAAGARLTPSSHGLGLGFPIP